jgi:hypothetical protein
LHPRVGYDVPERSNTEMTATTVVKYIISLDENPRIRTVRYFHVDLFLIRERLWSRSSATP